MPQDVYTVIYCCMLYVLVDDWDWEVNLDRRWDAYFSDTKMEGVDTIATN